MDGVAIIMVFQIVSWYSDLTSFKYVDPVEYLHYIGVLPSFFFLRRNHIFPYSYFKLPSHQQCTKSSTSCTLASVLVFVWHLIALLTYISLMTSSVKDYSAGWPFEKCLFRSLSHNILLILWEFTHADMYFDIYPHSLLKLLPHPSPSLPLLNFVYLFIIIICLLFIIIINIITTYQVQFVVP